MQLWVAGGEQPPRRDVAQEEVTLVPARKEYRAGESAEILVLAPFADAEGLLTLRRSGLVRSERFRMQGSSHTLRIPIEDAYVPNVHVQVDLVGKAPRTRDDGTPDPKLPQRPAFAVGHDRPRGAAAAAHAGRGRRRARTPRWSPAARPDLTLEVKDAAGQAGRRARSSRWSWWTRPSSRSPRYKVPTRSRSSTRSASPAWPTTTCARMSSSAGRTDRRASTDGRWPTAVAGGDASEGRGGRRGAPPPPPAGARGEDDVEDCGAGARPRPRPSRCAPTSAPSRCSRRR